jgi:hypothetical protein
LSINETSGKAAYSYKSTSAVTFLTEILENATAKRDKKRKCYFRNPKAKHKKSVPFFKNIHYGIPQKGFRENKINRWRAARQQAKNTILHYRNRKRLKNLRGIASLISRYNYKIMLHYATKIMAIFQLTRYFLLLQKRQYETSLFNKCFEVENDYSLYLCTIIK